MTLPARDQPPGAPSEVTWDSGQADDPLESREIALVDLLDRLLAGGVVLTGDLTLSIANVDLVHISLRALITSVRPKESDHRG